jgi:hypothetical protein
MSASDNEPMGSTFWANSSCEHAVLNPISERMTLTLVQVAENDAAVWVGLDRASASAAKRPAVPE